MQFATYEAVKRTEKKKDMKDPKVLPLPRGIPLATLAGAAAGFTSTILLYPFKAVNDRIVLNVSQFHTCLCLGMLHLEMCNRKRKKIVKNTINFCLWC